MSATTDARLSVLDQVLDAQTPSPTLAEELFALVDLLGGQPALRRALTDPSTADGGLEQLVSALFASRVSVAAQRLLIEAARLRWASASGLAAALERQGVRALLGSALSEGVLDDIEDELFRFGRVVDGDAELRATLADRAAPLAARQQLVADLLQARTRPATLALAQRAVAARLRTFDLTIAEYLKIAAHLRDRTIAKVVVARPLSEAQASRLRSALRGQLGHDITLQVTVDPRVLGGVRVSVGDEVIEGTVAKRLTDAERHIS